MFHKEFESNLMHDPTIFEITFSERNNEFIMEIQTIDGKEASKLTGEIHALRSYHNMDNPIKQNFELECYDVAKKVKIVGNIFNALNLLKNDGIISKDFIKLIEDDPEVRDFINRTKNYILPENTDENPPSSEEDLEENYVNYLLGINPVEFERAISYFTNNLASKGAEVEMRIINLKNKVEKAM